MWLGRITGYDRIERWAEETRSTYAQHIDDAEPHLDPIQDPQRLARIRSIATGESGGGLNDAERLQCIKQIIDAPSIGDRS